MTEQQLRAAVAEYDAELARSAHYNDFYELLSTKHGALEPFWEFNHTMVRRHLVAFYMESNVVNTYAATMRAMDAAAAAFEASLKESSK